MSVSAVKIYPQPINIYANILITSSAMGSPEINIYNISGKLVPRVKNQKEHGNAKVLLWPCKPVSAGAYIVMIKIAGKIIGRQKVMVRRQGEINAVIAFKDNIAKTCAGSDKTFGCRGHIIYKHIHIYFTFY
ncbi:T9SS type A sorting domain-containing protein [bacterium]|nr:T9SS type A sorting domain-containing protein [bacterium]